mmetsp:Transcript_35849/g.54973  ORF Transcript_35849/g.54973 Transcript_35849/m.54973 type:complete len:97 (+) Transcript_35849:1193-1483(+)
MFPAAAMKIFGLAHGGQIYSIMFFANSLASISSFLITYYGKDVSAHLVFLISSFLTLVNVGSVFFFNDQEMKKPSLSKKQVEEVLIGESEHHVDYK